MCGAIDCKVFARMLSAALQRGEQGKIEFLLASQKLFRRQWRLDAREPGGTTLFNRLYSDLTPLFDLVCRFFLSSWGGNDSLGEQWDDPKSTQLGCFLNDGLKRFSFGQGVQQGDLKGQGRDGAPFQHAQPDLAALNVLDFANQLSA